MVECQKPDSVRRGNKAAIGNAVVAAAAGTRRGLVRINQNRVYVYVDKPILTNIALLRCLFNTFGGYYCSYVYLTILWTITSIIILKDTSLKLILKYIRT